MRPSILLAGLLALLPAGAGHAERDDAPCRSQTFEGSRFTVCDYDSRRHALLLVFDDRRGRPLRSFLVLKEALGDRANRVRFAMNAGMFDRDGRPIGLFVAGGRERRPLNTRDGAGNFHMKPNGVFLVTDRGQVSVETSEAYARRRTLPAFATQSGPMLVIDGELHPAIQPDGPSRYVRNGVGVAGPTRAMFVLSEGAVSFGRFARFFRDELGVRDALYLDGAVSGLWSPAQSRRDITPPLGPFVVVSDR